MHTCGNAPADRRGGRMLGNRDALPALFALFCLGVPLQASGDAPPGVAEFVRESEAILAGTVERAWVEVDRRVHEPVTRVVLRDIRAVKGPGTDRRLITFWAPGALARSAPEGAPPAFRKGERYIFLVSDSLDAERMGYTPIFAMNAGLFPVLYDPSRGRSFVHDFLRRPVARIGRDRLVAPAAAPRGASRRAPASGRAFSTGPRIDVLPAADDPGTRVSEGDFLRLVREICAGANQEKL